MNKLYIIGNLVRNPESRTTQSGKQVCSFTVAVNRPRTSEGQPDADFFRVTAWNAMADNCARYLFKGKKVAVTGPVSVSTYKAQNGDMKAQMEVYAQEVEFLTPADKAHQNAPQPQKTDRQTGYAQADEDEDMPF
jgi:single-strand DNA-binding protein